MQLLALDFDGVISDSAPEAFIVALRTYRELRDGSPVGGLLAHVETLTASEVRSDPAYREFVAMLPLGNRAEDFAVELTLMNAGRTAANQEEFDAAFRAEPVGFLDAFHERFYEVRTTLRQADPTRWSQLLGPYPAFLSLLRRRAGDVRLSIATAKDRASVDLLLESYGVEDLFPKERVLDKTAGRSKRAHLESLHQRTGVAYSEIVFVDDKVNHLDDVAPLGVHGVLAAWGYNGPREALLAREQGHRVCTLDDFESQLFGPPTRGEADC